MEQQRSYSNSSLPLRWGIVGTGMIADQMAAMIKLARHSKLAAVASRRLKSAQDFAARHAVPVAFDSFKSMLVAADIDAVYVATPTIAREEICIAAARHGKHVLGEKPFASLASLQRITAECRDNGVGFMDGTHFVHHPRTAAVRKVIAENVGAPLSIASAFHFAVTNPRNIRLDPELEPMGAIGDAGWYNVRAAIEYGPADVDLLSVHAVARRHPKTSAVVAASVLIAFTDASTTTFHCGLDAGVENMDLRVCGSEGEVKITDFLINRQDNSAAYRYRDGLAAAGADEEIIIPADKPGAALMFENFARMTTDTKLFDRSVYASERTQGWLDAVWQAAMANGQESNA